ncbi:hypothetical protein MJO28_001969 [Puccinia striiformis f. sp. tritici]|uniref:Uncharacterized protein n=1 Tax=Puccinia striiformis f. sp. tritici TaxID=168172 RepID=A0ACC0EX72_9BASI|nr:hypothetical protein MJO28_001969 [Puccinia striiformis f. sp. tritici]
MITRIVRSRRRARIFQERKVHSTTQISAAAATASTEQTTPIINLSNFTPELIRSFSIIAHIDHGKSTLSDRLLELTRTIPQQPSPTASSSSSGHSNPNQLPTRNLQVLDQLAVERERGITVKAVAVSMFYTSQSGKTYLLNLIDTPGHVDFTTEVLRSLSATQGAILLVDATQGVQAQTLAVLQAARRRKLTILPVLNKLDLPSAEPEKVALQVGRLLSNDDAHNDIIKISAKTGDGVQDLLDALVLKLPPPIADPHQPLRAFVFDSWFDHFQGVVSLVSIADGRIQKGDKIKSFKTGKTFQVADCGIMHPHQLSIPTAILGDTFYAAKTPITEIEPVNQSIETRQSMVFAGLYPIDSNAFDRLADAIQRLVLNDRSVTVHKESSVALGQGFRLGFLGTLHMDVFRQRLNDEYASEVIITRPFVPLQLDFPNIRNRGDGVKVFERIIDGTIIVPDRFTGPVMELCSSHRGLQQTFEYITAPSSEGKKDGEVMLEGDERWVEIRYKIPLSEIVTTFHSTLKSLSSGYATFDYETPEGDQGFIEADLVRVDIVVNKSSPIDAFATVIHRDHALREAKAILTRLKSVIPRQQFEIALQATIGSKIIASERITAVRKDVTAGLYGGHYERKMKHLQKQKEGKKKLRSLSIGKVEIPQEAFSAVLSVDGKVSATVSGNKRR